MKKMDHFALNTIVFPRFKLNYLYAAGNSQEGDVSESFCSLNKETILTSTSTQGPKPYLFVPQQVCANFAWQ